MKTLNQLKGIAVIVLLLVAMPGFTQTSKTDFQLHRAAVNMAKAFRQFQKADNAFVNGQDDAAVKHLSKGMDHFEMALEHYEKAEEDAYEKAGREIDRGNEELQKSIDEYALGNEDSASKHYAKALDYFDRALDLID